jgi:leucyl aminopeptidase
MTYAIKDLGVKSIATIATLTGAITIALGDVYTGY